ncbi:CHAT domain-containing protein [Altererythrobacter salegens]|uniref:CHAT domain-containing protein n=1 Tax=Croceibacterium salegens TaxID=1737568 RepID=A0A6I4SY02_9SPHN|nr:CHAT domain-containing protein [Croceibacterium salegens]MXO60891.1 CHAT domain-containing protein [Croceibacterium salegens]
MRALISASAIVSLLAACDQAASDDGTKSAPQALLGEPSPQAVLPPVDPLLAPLRNDLEPGDEEVLLEAIAGQQLFSRQMRRKDETGEVVALGRERDVARARATLAAIPEKLRSLSAGGVPTYALLHWIDEDNLVHAWLFGPEGGPAYSVSVDPYEGLGAMAEGLGVTTLAASRGPRPEGAPEMSEDEVRALQARDQSPASVAQRKKTIEHTAETLIPGAIHAALAERHGRLLVVPVKDTGSAPYGAFPLGKGVAAASWSFVVVKDIEALADPREVLDYRSLDLDRAVIVGNPDLSEDPYYDWKDLAGAEKEAHQVHAMLARPDNPLLIGKAATRGAVTKAIDADPKAGLIYMATHAIADPKNPRTRGFVALAGRDGRFYGSWISESKFKGWNDRHQPLVVMSACQTALGRVLDGGTFGIARSWEAAGAGQVVASLWNVSDSATQRLMKAFISRLKAGDAPEIAMQKAQIATMNYADDKGRQPYRDDPKMWAGFMVYGKPAMISRPQG